MNDYNLNSNPQLIRLIIENEKKAESKYRAEHPDSLIPFFEQELRKLGYEFEVASQIRGFLPKHRKIILPIVIKYYLQTKFENEKNYFLSLFHYRGFEEAVPIILDDFLSPDTSRLTRELISDTLYQIRSNKYIDEYLEILSNPEYEHYSLFITLLLSSLKVNDAVPVFIKMLENDELCALGLRALGNYNREEFRSYFLRYENDKRSSVRKYARAALNKLGKYREHEQFDPNGLSSDA
jgi:hypothetical protein